MTKAEFEQKFLAWIKEHIDPVTDDFLLILMNKNGASIFQSKRTLASIISCLRFQVKAAADLSAIVGEKGSHPLYTDIANQLEILKARIIEDYKALEEVANER